MPSMRDLTGETFGRWTVIEREGRRGKKVAWRCVCECGETKTVTAYSLTSGKSASCGCYQRQLATKHGATDCRGYKSPEYNSWLSMKARCNRESDPNYHRYGGRGIKVCERWNHDFAAFLADMGPRPSLAYSLDRVDNDGNYESRNCRWATSAEQAANRTWNPKSHWAVAEDRDELGRFVPKEAA